MADADGNSSTAKNADAQKLRNMFLAKYEGNITKGLYDDRDVEKLKKNDSYVASFIRDFETMEDARDRLHETLKWRLEYGMNDMTEDDFEREGWEKGAVFFLNRDKEGHEILYVLVKHHERGAEMLKIVKRFLAFHLEMKYRADPDCQLVVMFDMSGAGLSNLDLEVIRYMLNCFKIYYPTLLAYFMIYEMPWLFNAAWKIIKTWLSPQARDKIKFTNKTDVQMYINKDQLLERMGGTDKYEYKYEDSLAWCVGAGDSSQVSAVRKRVTFADQDSSDFKSVSNDMSRDTEVPELTKSAISHPDQKSENTNSIYGRSNPLRMKKENQDNSFIGRLLTISPAEELEFVVDDTDKDIYDVITLKNTLPYSIAYKVKTTSPEKYRVRPSSGIVKAGSSVEVFVYLQHGYQNTVHRDKFLIMAMEITEENSDSLSELWKSVQKESIMEHRLRCSVAHGTGGKASSSSMVAPSMSSGTVAEQLADVNQKMDQLIQCTVQMQQANHWMAFLLVLLILIIVLCFGIWFVRTVYYPVPLLSNKTDWCTGGLF